MKHFLLVTLLIVLALDSLRPKGAGIRRPCVESFGWNVEKTYTADDLKALGEITSGLQRRHLRWRLADGFAQRCRH